MNQYRLVLGALGVCIALPFFVVAQESGGPEQNSEPGKEAFGKNGDGRGLPAWLKLGFEYRGRVEATQMFDSDADDNAYLSRLRADVGVQPLTWLRFFVQGQDVRALRFGSQGKADDLTDTVDLRQAYADIGNSEQGWLVRVGRQELAFGDERLIGADSSWDCFGQEFDALTVSYTALRYTARMFIGFRVQAASRRPDPFDPAKRISGLSVPFKMRGQGVFEPYLFWKRGQNTADLMDRPGHRDVITPGVRLQGDLPLDLDYNVEMAIQRGHVVADTISAWAGHWELGWKPLGNESGLRLEVEYNFASGDKNPADGRQGTFDDLYPAGFNKYGMADPIAWRNIQYPAVSAEVPVTRRCKIYAGYRQFRLVTVHDGLYPGGDEYLIRNPAANSRDVGSNVLLATSWPLSSHWKILGGYGQLFSGHFLRQSGFGEVLRTAYVQLSVGF